MVTAIPNDIRLMGPLKPMRFEAHVEDCVVTEGEIPPQLNGGFYRVGPTWKRPTKQGFNGLASTDAMVQGMIFADGRAHFTNKWVETPKYLLEQKHNTSLFDWTDGVFTDWRGYGLGASIPNEYTGGVPGGSPIVNVFPFAGELLASGEQGIPPVAIDPVTLETHGIVPWSHRLSPGMTPPACFGDNAFTAHPKWDAASGILYGWSYRDVRAIRHAALGAPRRTDRNTGYRRRAVRAKRPRHVAHRELCSTPLPAIPRRPEADRAWPVGIRMGPHAADQTCPDLPQRHQCADQVGHG